MQPRLSKNVCAALTPSRDVVRVDGILTLIEIFQAANDRPHPPNAHHGTRAGLVKALLGDLVSRPLVLSAYVGAADAGSAKSAAGCSVASIVVSFPQSQVGLMIRQGPPRRAPLRSIVFAVPSFVVFAESLIPKHRSQPVRPQEPEKPGVLGRVQAEPFVQCAKRQLLLRVGRFSVAAPVQCRHATSQSSSSKAEASSGQSTQMISSLPC